MNPPLISELEGDEPLPETSGGDSILVLIQSPSRLFVYWVLGRDPFETLGEAFGEMAADYKLAVRVTDLDLGEVTTLELEPAARDHWHDVNPDKTYVVEVGLRATGRPFIRLLSSGEVRTPRAAASTGPAPLPPCEQAKQLHDDGDVEGAIEVLFDLDRSRQGKATAAVALMFSPADVPKMDADELLEMQNLLLALAHGEDYLELLEGIDSDALAKWLIHTRDKNGLDATDSGKKVISGIPDAEHLYDKLFSELCVEAAPLPHAAPTEPARPRPLLWERLYHFGDDFDVSQQHRPSPPPWRP